jgi:hypothetical protein
MFLPVLSARIGAHPQTHCLKLRKAARRTQRHQSSGVIPARWPMEPSARLRTYDGYRDVPPHQCKAYGSGTPIGHAIQA